jgi:cell division septation protein DedD
MSQKRIWIFGMVAAMLVVAIGGWVLGISPILDQIGAANSQVTTIAASNQASQAQLASLKVRFAGIDKLRVNLDRLRLSIPEGQAASEFLDEVNSLSGATGASVQSVSIASATIYTAPVPAASATATATSSASPTATPTATPVAPTTPTATAGGLVIIPVTVNIQGTLAADQQFIGLLQTGQRLFVSSTVSMTSGDGLMVTVITGEIFSLQGTSDQKAVKKTTSPVYSTPTATPTPTPTPTATKAAAKTGTSGGTTTAAAPTATPTPTPTSTGP